MTTILPNFVAFPKEAEIIGRLMAGYGELEYDLCLAVAMALDDLDTTVKAMFRARGETQRIDIADALARQAYMSLNLETLFSEAIGGIRYCLKIRNQFSHCNWHDDRRGKLGFINLEEVAVKHAYIKDFGTLKTHHIDETLLKQQEAYFVFVRECLEYLNFEARKLAGRLATHRFSVPKKAQQPPLYIP